MLRSSAVFDSSIWERGARDHDAIDAMLSRTSFATQSISREILVSARLRGGSDEVSCRQRDF